MTLMEWLLLGGIIVVALWGLRSAIRLANYKFEVEHGKRIPATGNFRIKLPAEQWDKGFQRGAFAFGITDKNEKVIMTMTVEKGE